MTSPKSLSSKDIETIDRILFLQLSFKTQLKQSRLEIKEKRLSKKVKQMSNAVLLAVASFERIAD